MIYAVEIRDSDDRSWTLHVEAVDQDDAIWAVMGRGWKRAEITSVGPVEHPSVHRQRVTVEQAVNLLGCSRRTVQRLIRSGDLVKLGHRPSDGRRVMIDGDSVEALRSRWFAPGTEPVSA